MEKNNTKHHFNNQNWYFGITCLYFRECYHNNTNVQKSNTKGCLLLSKVIPTHQNN